MSNTKKYYLRNPITEKEEYDRKLTAYKSAVNRMKYDAKKKPSTSIYKYDINMLSKWMQSPVHYERQLRNISNYFYNVSALYRLIIRYMALMPTYAYVINPVEIPEKLDVAKYKKQFIKTGQHIDKLNLPHEMIKAMLVAFREDAFFGYEHESKDSFFIQHLDGNNCRISSEEDGVFNFQFNFAHFDSNKEDLLNYPEEFRIKYAIYQTTKENWIELDSDKTVCFKVNLDFQYELPPFSSMFESIFDLDEYKKIKKARAKNDNFMAMVQKIPMDEKNPDINKFLIDLDLAMTFHNMAADSLPDGVQMITSPMGIEAIKTEKSRSDSDYVNDAYREAFNEAGVSQFIFNSDKNTSIGLAKSILSDEQILFSMLRQIERWINRKLKKMNGQYKFKVKMLDVTVFNRDEAQKSYLTAAQNGLPVKFELGATYGITPVDFINKINLENDIFKLQDSMVPLATSHTQTGDEASTGRPVKSDSTISDSGQTSRDKDSDNRKKQG